MAKKTIDSQDDIFAELIKQQNEVSPNAAVLGSEMFSDIKIYIPTGACALDTIISNKIPGGWPSGRTIELYGQESIGKSTLVYSSFKSVQKLGGICIYFDIERAGSKEMMQTCGVNVNKLITSNLFTVEEIFTALEKNLTTIISNKNYNNKPVLVCLDSYAQMSTDAESEGTYEFNMNIDLKKARQFGKAIRKITPLLNKANACLIVINQLRDNPNATYGDPTCVDPYSTIVTIKYTLENITSKQTEEVTENISLEKLGRYFVNINDFKTPQEIDISDYGIQILGKDLNTGKDVYKNVLKYIVKPPVDYYFSNGVLKGTSAHRIIIDDENDSEIFLCDHEEFSRVNSSMDVVDLIVEDVENYYANGFLNHNTTPGGKALKFAASVRIKLMGKTAVKMPDPIMEKMYEDAVIAWEQSKKDWEDNGKSGEKPVKPKKGDYKGDEITIGYDVEAKTVKNKIAPPDRIAEFRIIFTEGIVEEPAWFSYCLKFLIIEKVSSFEYAFTKDSGIKYLNQDKEQIWFKESEWLDVMADVEIRKKVKQYVTEKLIKKTKASELISVPLLGDEEGKEFFVD